MLSHYVMSHALFTSHQLQQQQLPTSSSTSASASPQHEKQDLKPWRDWRQINTLHHPTLWYVYKNQSQRVVKPSGHRS